jgi:hypothetical protein
MSLFNTKKMTLDKAMENESCGSELDMTAEEEAKLRVRFNEEISMNQDQQYQCLYYTVNPGRFEADCHILTEMRIALSKPDYQCQTKETFENDLRKKFGKMDGPVTHGVVENLGMGIAESFLQIIKDRKEYEKSD